MSRSDLHRKGLYLLAFVAVFVALIFLFPYLEEWVYAYLTSSLGLIISPDGTVSTTSGEPASKMAETSIGIVVTLLQILKIILWMGLVVVLVRSLGQSITRTIYRNTAPGEISSIIKTVLSVIVYIVAFFIIFQSQFPGVQLAPLFTGSTIVGIVVGLALQDTLGNLFAGLALQADQPFQVGDVVTISTRGVGVVEAVSWRGVKIRTFQNRLLIISNSVLGKETIEVAPKDNLNARSVFFNSLYSNSPARTTKAVREAIRHVENVSTKIRPVVRIRNLGESGIDWEVKYWLDDYTRHNDTDALIRERIWYVFNREKIDFAFPTRTVHVEPKPVDIGLEEMLNQNVESLSRVSIFAPLSHEEVERLASASELRTYAPGEPIVRMGRDGNSMFVITGGSVNVQVPDGLTQRTVNSLRDSDFFGEMSLLTGEPRAASVISDEETEVLEIRKEGLQPILEDNPGLVDAISEIVEERRATLTPQSREPSAEAAANPEGVLISIRKFFGLR